MSIKWLKYFSVPVWTFDRQLRKLLPLLIVDVNGTLQYFNHFIDTHFITSFWCNIKIIMVYLNCKAEPSTTIRPICLL